MLMCIHVDIDMDGMKRQKGTTDCALPTRRTTGTRLGPMVLKMSLPSWPGTVVITIFSIRDFRRFAAVKSVTSSVKLWTHQC